VYKLNFFLIILFPFKFLFFFKFDSTDFKYIILEGVHQIILLGVHLIIVFRREIDKIHHQLLMNKHIFTFT